MPFVTHRTKKLNRRWSWVSFLGLWVAGCGGKEPPPPTPKPAPAAPATNVKKVSPREDDAPPAAAKSGSAERSEEGDADKPKSDKSDDKQTASAKSDEQKASDKKSGDKKKSSDTASDKKTAKSDKKTAAGDKKSAADKADIPLPKLNLSWLMDREQHTAISSDGRLLVVGNRSGALRAFDVEAGAIAHLFPEQPHGIGVVTVNAQANELAAATIDGRVRFFSTAPQQAGFDAYSYLSGLRNDPRQRGFGAHMGALTSMDFHPSGKSFVTAGIDGTVKTWRYPPVAPTALSLGDFGQAIVAISRDSQVAATANSAGEITVWDLAKQEKSRSFRCPGAPFTRLLIVPETNWLLAGSSTGLIAAMNLVDGNVMTQLLGHQGAISVLQLVNDGHGLLTADELGEVRLWNLPLTPHAQLAKFDRPVEVIRVSRDQQWGAVFTKGDGVTLLDTRNRSQRSLAETKDVRTFEFSPGSTHIAAGTAKGELRLWSVGSSTPEGELETGEYPVRSVAFHPEEKLLAIGSESGRVQIVDWPRGRLRSSGIPSSVAWLGSTPRGETMASVSFENQLSLWKPDERQPSFTKSLAEFGQVTALGLSEILVAVANESNQVLLLSLQDPTKEAVVTLGDARLAQLGFDAAQVNLVARDAKGKAASVAIPEQFARPETADTTTVREALEIPLPNEPSQIAVAPDGTWIAWAADKKIVGRATNDSAKTTEWTFDAVPSRLAIAADGKALAVLIGQEIRVVDPTGKIVERQKLDRPGAAVAFRGRTTELVRLGPKQKSGFQLLDRTFDGAIEQLAMSSDGKLLAIGVANGSVHVVTANTGDEVARFDTARAGILRLGFSLDNAMVHCTTRDQGGFQWQLETKDLVLKTEWGRAVADASLIDVPRGFAVLGIDHSLRLIDPVSKEVLQNIELPSDAPNTPASEPGTSASPDAKSKPNPSGARIVAIHATPKQNGMWLAGSDGSVWSVSASASRVLRPFGVTGVKDAILMTRGMYLISVSQEDAIAMHQLTGQEIRQFSGHAGVVAGIALVQQGTQLAAAVDQAGQGKLNLWSIADGQEVGALPLWSAPRRLIRGESDQRYLLVDRQKHLHVYDSQTNHLLERIEAIDEVHDGRLSMSLDTVWTTEGDGTLRRYSVQAMKLMPGLTEPATVVQWSPDGKQITGGTNGKIVIWNGETGEVTATLPIGPTAVTALREDRRGQLFVAGQDGSVKQWSIAKLANLTGDVPPEQEFKHERPVYTLAISTDGKSLATGGEDQTVRLWDVAKGKVLAELVGHSGKIQGVEFDRTQTKLLSTASDRSARVWNLSPARAASANEQAEPAKISTAVSNIANLSVAGQELRQSLEKNLSASRDDVAKARIRAMMRQVNDSDTASSRIALPAQGSHRTEQLRSALRQANTPATRQQVRQQLIASLRDDDIRRRVAAARTDKERADLRNILESRRAEDTDAPKSDAELWHQLDRRWLEANADGRTKIKSEIDELAKSKVIWPRGNNAARENERSHLLTSITTDFEFDAKIFRRVELAISRDEWNLAAARESAALSNNRQVVGIVRVWDIPTKTELRSWNDVERGVLKAIQFDPTGQAILTIPDVFGFELSNGWSREVARAATVSLSPDGQLALLGHRGLEREHGDAVTLLELTSMQTREAKLQAYESMVPALAMSPDGKLIAVCIRERMKHRLLLLDGQTLSVKRVLEEFNHKESWLSPMEEYVPGVTLLQFSPDGQQLIAYGHYGPDDYRVVTFQVRDGKSSVQKNDKPLPRKGSLRPMVFVSGRPYMAVETEAALVVADIRENRPVREIPWKAPNGDKRIHAISHDGTILAFGDSTGEVELIRLDREDESAKFRAHDGPVVGLAFSPSDHTLITAGEENQIRLWSLSAFQHSRLAKPATSKKSSPGNTTKKKRP